MRSIEEERANLEKIMKGIAMQFGENCEVVLHDFSKDHEHTIVAIENRHVTNRSVGGGITSNGLEIMRGTKPAVDEYHYLNQSQNGKLLKSTSIYLYDDDGNVLGSMCINLDITSLIAARTLIDGLVSASDYSAPAPQYAEIVTDDVNEMLEILIQKSVQYVGMPVEAMSREDKMKGLRYLDERGAFLVKKSSDRIAQYYEISRFTLYNYLDTIHSAAPEEE